MPKTAIINQDPIYARNIGEKIKDQISLRSNNNCFKQTGQIRRASQVQQVHKGYTKKSKKNGEIIGKNCKRFITKLQIVFRPKKIIFKKVQYKEMDLLSYQYANFSIFANFSIGSNQHFQKSLNFSSFSFITFFPIFFWFY